MRQLAFAILLVPASGWSAVALTQEPPVPQPQAEVRVSGPTVIAFWHVPASDAELEADPGLASALDDQQYYWAESRAPLAAAGITATEQPGRRFIVREPGRAWLFTASADSAEIGYLLVRPGHPPRVLYRVWHPDELLAEARDFFGMPGDRREAGPGTGVVRPGAEEATSGGSGGVGAR
ncbi:MAG TPA: hypothetical protein VFU00_11285 [Gemmatimonadales bacterium]|nr:hypothetical protein [Gemmatimonadales bacterium]